MIMIDPDFYEESRWDAGRFFRRQRRKDGGIYRHNGAMIGSGWTAAAAVTPTVAGDWISHFWAPACDRIYFAFSHFQCLGEMVRVAGQWRLGRQWENRHPEGESFACRDYYGYEIVTPTERTTRVWRLADQAYVGAITPPENHFLSAPHLSSNVLCYAAFRDEGGSAYRLPGLERIPYVETRSIATDSFMLCADGATHIVVDLTRDQVVDVGDLRSIHHYFQLINPQTWGADGMIYFQRERSATLPFYRLRAGSDALVELENPLRFAPDEQPFFMLPDGGMLHGHQRFGWDADGKAVYHGPGAWLDRSHGLDAFCLSPDGKLILTRNSPLETVSWLMIFESAEHFANAEPLLVSGAPSRSQ